jgi:methanethiol oxidase
MSSHRCPIDMEENRMKTSIRARTVAALAVFACVALPVAPAFADETCNSPYISKLIKGQEDYVYVWTLGMEGMGDGQDKLVTIDVNPNSMSYGNVTGTHSVGTRGEAHHMGFSDDRRFLWAGGLDDSKIYIFDVRANPARPKLIKTISDMAEKTGLVGPHTFYALPGRMMVQALSNNKDHGGATGFAIYNNKGNFVSKHDMPTDNGGDGYGYDIGINPGKNVMLTSSFTGWNNYMMDLGKLVKDPEAMKKFGSTMVVWDLKAMQPKKVLNVPGAPLEIRWSLKPGDNWAITATALTSKLTLVKRDAQGEWQAHEVGTIGDPSKIPLPVDISITANGKGLWVNTFMDGKTRYFDLSDPMNAKQTYEKVTGKQVNMVSQSWDGKRVYITSSLLANWDKKGEDNEQFLRVFDWDGKELALKMQVDFIKNNLGRAHHMKFGSKKLRTAMPQASDSITAMVEEPLAAQVARGE